jgi:WD40 repeat protein
MSLVSDELTESNRRIEELAAALQAERERAAAAEAALRDQSPGAHPQPNTLAHKRPSPGEATEQSEISRRAVERDEMVWNGRIFDARMFISYHPVLTEHAAFQKLPSVVTWFRAASQHGLLDQAAMSFKSVRATAPVVSNAEVAAIGSDVHISVEEVRQLREHEADVWCCALHPLVPLVATGSSDTTVRLWRLDGECLRVLRGHTEWIYTVAFDSMGDKLCSGAFDGTLRLWGVSTGECIRVIRSSGASFHSVAFQPPTCTYLAAGSAEHAVRIYRVADGEVARTLVGHRNSVTCVAFQPPDGALLATSSVDCTLRVWRLGDGACIRVLGERSKHKVWCCAFDSSGRLIASGGADSVVRIWRVADGTVLSALQGHKGAVRCLAFHPHLTGVVASGEGNLTWGSDNSVRVWLVGESVQALAEAAGGTALEMVAGESKAVSHGHTRMVTCLAFAPDGSALVSTSRDGCARLLHVHVSDCQRNLDVDLGGIDLVLTRDGENKAAAPPVAGSKGLPGLPLASPSSLALSLARALPLLCACWLGAATRGCLQA